MKNIPLRRSIAFLIDMVIVGIVTAFFENLFPVTIPTHDFEISGIQLTLGISPAPVFYGLYFVVFDMISNGQTTGKLISGILVVSKNGEVPSRRKRLLRSLHKMLGVLIFPVAVSLFLFGDYTIQDHYVGTITVRFGSYVKPL